MFLTIFDVLAYFSDRLSPETVDVGIPRDLRFVIIAVEDL